jgi:hypothetical protein
LRYWPDFVLAIFLESFSAPGSSAPWVRDSASKRTHSLGGCFE